MATTHTIACPNCDKELTVENDGPVNDAVSGTCANCNAHVTVSHEDGDDAAATQAQVVKQPVDGDQNDNPEHERRRFF